MKLYPSYKPLEITLIRKSKMKKHLREDLGISGTTLARMSNQEAVSMDVLLKICEYLNCRIENVVEFVDKDGNLPGSYVREENGYIIVKPADKGNLMDSF